MTANQVVSNHLPRTLAMGNAVHHSYLECQGVNDHGWAAARHLRGVDVISECETNGSGMEFGIGNVEMRLR